MRLRGYVEKWLRSILGDTVSKASTGTTIIMAIAALVAPRLSQRLLPDPATAITELTWQIPLTLFVLFFIFSLIRTSFRLYSELQQQTNQVIGELEAENMVLKDTRASLEYCFHHGPPYEPSDIAYYRIGVHNRGPATAKAVKVRLLRITPPNLLPDYLLPTIMTWMNSGTERDIVACQEEALDVLFYQFDESEKEVPLAIQLWTIDSRSSFKLRDGQECRLHLQASAANAQLCNWQFVVRAQGNRVIFDPTED